MLYTERHFLAHVRYLNIRVVATPKVEDSSSITPFANDAVRQVLVHEVNMGLSMYNSVWCYVCYFSSGSLRYRRRFFGYRRRFVGF